MIKSVAKHKYLRGRNAPGKARAHVNYVAYRSETREEKVRGGREFFDSRRDGLDAREVKDLVYSQSDDRNFVMHKLILSPGVQSVDMKDYTREVMDKLGQEKRLDLEWRAVVHENTEHKHAHVILMGKDKNGHQVRIRRDDHQFLRKAGDEYLDREHKLDRFLDREMNTLLRSKDYDRGGDDRFKSLFFGGTSLKEKDKNRDEEAFRDRREFDKLDKDLKKAFGLDERKAETDFGKGSKQHLRESQGRLSDFHSHALTMKAQLAYEAIKNQNPELAEVARQDMEAAKRMERELAYGKKTDLSRLFGFDKTERGQERAGFETWQIAETNRQVEESQKPAPLEQPKPPEKDRGDDTLDRGGANK